MSDKFIFTETHKRNLILLSVFGAVLMCLGFFLSNIKGEEEGPAEEAKEEVSITPVKQVVTAELPKLTLKDSSELWHPAFPARAYLWAGNVKAEHEIAEAPGTMSKFGGALLMGTWFFMGISIFGIFFLAIGYVSNAGWFVALKRVPESFYMFLPVVIIGMVIIFFVFGKYIWAHWVGTPEGVDELVDGKRGFLNPVFFMVLAVGIVGLWFFFGHKFRKSSLQEDSTGGMDQFQFRRRLALLFLPIFAFPFSAIAFQWLMSIETHWFSTMYAVYCFAGVFISGMTMTMLITVSLKQKGYLPEVTSEHLHDMGKFMFAFSVFWGYIFISQFLLIWYANMPEETVHFRFRYDHHKFLFFFNIVMNFFVPFFVLMTRNAKRNFSSLKTIAVLILIGRFSDLYLLVTPGVMLGDSGMGYYIMCAGTVLMFAGVFLFIIYNTIAKAPITAKNHPYLEESIHHTTGV